ncbi:hypothetical protein CLV51_105170 [Chitinophaga niastensis]|uniref:Baseplate J-like protein n=1 Tax=Chitinophaga niastensis TaxID=536980 RepID=A0A2P8HEZ7_CHINA|nr:hypothetical protein [Chitinophaga niastensis]PSL44798.1 hypothetical protein CLV51_105170 [Chitinophaga niastensis]
MSNCQCHTEINRDGSGQLNRYLSALDPSYAAVDGRSLEDLLVFARRYAAQIRFYDIPGSTIKDDTVPAKVSWAEFFRRDMAVIAASIGTIDLDAIKKDYDDLHTQLDLHPDADIFESLFKPVIGIMVRLDGWYTLAIPQNPLYADLHLAINSNLSEQTKKMIAYAEGFRAVDTKKTILLDFTAIKNDAVWKINDTIFADESIYIGATPEDRIRYAALFVDDVFLSFFGLISQLVNNADGYLQFAIQQYPAHQPHMGLFIAFLELFRRAQDQMNGLTARMLDFYYRDVLHLTEKPSLPDRAHVIFELAKDVTAYDIAPGTALSAGKDLSNKDQIYQTEGGLVVNQAKVKELKTIFIDKSPVDALEENKTVNTIYARPVANSQDGFGAKFTDPYPMWPTFGQGIPQDTKFLNKYCHILDVYHQLYDRHDQARVGFAVASPQLLLQGGKRYLEIQATGLNVLLKDAATLTPGDNLFEIWFTGEKEWVKIDQVLDLSAMQTTLTQNGVFPLDDNITTSGYSISGPADTICIYLPMSESAVIGFDSKLHKGYEFTTTLPVMRIMLHPDIKLAAPDYNNLSVKDFAISVRVGSINPKIQTTGGGTIPIPAAATGPKVDLTGSHFDGLKTLVLQNDAGVQPVGKPFDPFSAYPVMGKSFYLGSGEVFNKSLSALAVNIRRTVDPEFGTANNDPATGAVHPKYSVSLLEERAWVPLNASSDNTNTGPDFDTLALTHNILNQLIAKDLPDLSYQPVPYTRSPILPVTEWNLQTVKGFLRITSLVSVNADAITFFAESAKLARELQIKEISVSYYSAPETLTQGIDQFFHVYPFGVAEIELPVSKTTGSSELEGITMKRNLTYQNFLPVMRKAAVANLLDAHNCLLPQFTYKSPYSDYSHGISSSINNSTGNNLTVNAVNDSVMGRLLLNASGISSRLTGGFNQYSNVFQEEGMLFIGLENLQPLQTLSLLFEFADGTAEDEDNDPPQINWSYLINNAWRPLNGEFIVSDGTYGFQTTGIMKIDIPEDATNHNTIITDGLHWLCASVTAYANRFPQLINVVAQATEVVFVDNGNDQRHFDTALPAGTISKLSVKVAEISKVQQPFASFDGKHKEVGKEFYTRVSERLRHKGRAITAWDYEHLVLDHFPIIYKVKCITHTDPDCLCRHSGVKPDVPNEVFCCGPQVAPGHVLMVPIANLKNRNAINPLQPKTGRRTMLEIEQYLQQRTSPFVKVRARNPVYEQVLVFFRVKFVTGTDKGYFLKKLNQEIVQFLTPWAFDQNAEVKFGQKIYASAVINFIEERTYVDFITDFLMFVCSEGCCPDTPATATDQPNTGKDDLASQFNNVKGCDDLEHLEQDKSNFIGIVVATPSTPRSILVSVPQHIIIPYEAPPALSPCEKRRTTMVTNTPAPIRMVATPAPVATTTPTATPVLVATPAAVVVNPAPAPAPPPSPADTPKTMPADEIPTENTDPAAEKTKPPGKKTPNK